MARALSWGAMAVGMVFFTGVALINGWSCITSRRTARRPLCRSCYDGVNRCCLLWLARQSAVSCWADRRRPSRAAVSRSRHAGPAAWAGLVVVLFRGVEHRVGDRALLSER